MALAQGEPSYAFTHSPGKSEHRCSHARWMLNAAGFSCNFTFRCVCRFCVLVLRFTVFTRFMPIEMLLLLLLVLLLNNSIFLSLLPLFSEPIYAVTLAVCAVCSRFGLFVFEKFSILGRCEKAQIRIGIAHMARIHSLSLSLALSAPLTANNGYLIL